MQGPRSLLTSSNSTSWKGNAKTATRLLSLLDQHSTSTRLYLERTSLSEPFPVQAASIVPYPPSLKPLYSLKTSIHPSCGADRQMPVLYSLLTNSPNLRELNINEGSCGCVISDRMPPAFHFREGDRFPPLSELKLHGYDFGTTAWPEGYRFYGPDPLYSRLMSALDVIWK